MDGISNSEVRNNKQIYDKKISRCNIVKNIYLMIWQQLGWLQQWPGEYDDGLGGHCNGFGGFGVSGGKNGFLKWPGHIPFSSNTHIYHIKPDLFNEYDKPRSSCWSLKTLPRIVTILIEQLRSLTP